MVLGAVLIAVDTQLVLVVLLELMKELILMPVDLMFLEVLNLMEKGR